MRSRVPQHREPSRIRGAWTRGGGLAAGESYGESNICGQGEREGELE
jgi:hypothetical protein